MQLLRLPVSRCVKRIIVSIEPVIYFAVMPINLYAVGDHYGLHNSHVLPALICKMHDAKHGGPKKVIL